MSNDDKSPRQIVERHRRHVEVTAALEPAVRDYAIMVCDDILNDLPAHRPPIDAPLPEEMRMDTSLALDEVHSLEQWFLENGHDKESPAMLSLRQIRKALSAVSPLVAPRRYRMAEMFSKMVEDENGDWVRFDSLDMNNG